MSPVWPERLGGVDVRGCYDLVRSWRFGRAEMQTQRTECARIVKLEVEV